MRLPISALLAACCAIGAADHFILSPIGQKLPYGTLKFDHLFSGGKRDVFTDSLGIGLTTVIESELTFSHAPGRRDRASINLAYNVVGPVVELVPGVSIGVQDALNETPEGRRFYWVTTYHFGLDGQYNSRTPMEFTMGATAGSRTGGLFCISYPFSSWFKLLGEYDTGRITHGLECKPARDTTIRWLFRNQETFWSASWTLRF